MKLSQLLNVAMGNTFRKCFSCFRALEDWVLHPGTYQFTALNQKPIMIVLWVFTVLNVYTDTINHSKHHLLNHKKAQNYFPVFTREPKASWKNCSSNFIYILSRILKKQLKVYPLMYNNVSDDVTEFEQFGFIKNAKI